MTVPVPTTSPLGQPTPYPDRVDPSVLCPLPRAPHRAALGWEGAVPFVGADLWTAYELSWLNPRGKPQVALAELTVPCDTPQLVESKSLKLYLNGYANERFADAAAVRERIVIDLSAALWRGAGAASRVGLRLRLPEQFAGLDHGELAGLSLDRLDLECTHTAPAPQLLRADTGTAPVEELLFSDLLRSLCPVTGQPDWGSVQIAYRGPQIDHGGLLGYVVSLRNESGFHEQCVERIYAEIWQRCQPTRLSVLARYTRRGGIDINPWRTSHPQVAPPFRRTARQ